MAREHLGVLMAQHVLNAPRQLIFFIRLQQKDRAGQVSKTCQARDPAQQEALLRIFMESPCIPTREAQQAQWSRWEDAVFAGIRLKSAAAQQKTQLSSPTPSLLPPLLPACTPLPLPCRVWQREESSPSMDLSPLEPPASSACLAPEGGASLSCSSSFQKETEKES